MGVLKIGISAMVIENKVKTLTITTFLFQPSKSSVPLHSRKQDVQAIYAKELPISSPDPITPPAILTLSSILPLSLLFNPRYFFILEELLPPKKQICSPSSSSTTLSNSSRNQTHNLVSPSSSVYTPTPPQRMEEGRINGNELKIELKKIRTQIIKLQKKQLGQKDKIAFAYYRISDLERIIEKVQARHQMDQEDL
ncbi:hypothetical protein Tco_0733833 [Tanacetum coccineum]